MNAVPLVRIQGSGPQGEPQVGDLVTVALFNNKRSGARLTRISYGSYYVTICGLTTPQPYQIGDRLVLNREQVIDWGTA